MRSSDRNHKIILDFLGMPIEKVKGHELKVLWKRYKMKGQKYSINLNFLVGYRDTGDEDLVMLTVVVER